MSVKSEPYRRLLSRVRQLNGALVQEDHDPVLGRSDQLDVALLDTLLRQLQDSHPAAGPRYWSARLWQLTTWQPVYLAVAASDAGLGVSLDGLYQSVRPGVITGFTLPPRAVIDCRDDASTAFLSDHHCLQYNAEQLRVFVDRYFALVNDVITLCRANSYGQVADTLHFALLAAGGAGRRDQLARAGQLWSKASGLVDRRGAPMSGFSDQHSQLTVARRSCCRHHLIEPGPHAYCEDCPLHRKRLAAASRSSGVIGNGFSTTQNKKVNYGNGSPTPLARH